MKLMKFSAFSPQPASHSKDREGLGSTCRMPESPSSTASDGIVVVHNSWSLQSALKKLVSKLTPGQRPRWQQPTKKGDVKVTFIPWNDINLVTQIAHGPLYTVFKGQWNGYRVAVKVLRPEVCNNERVVHLMQDEARLQTARQHRRIGRVYGVTSDGKQYHGVVCHLYRGGTLNAFLHGSAGKATPGQVVYADLSIIWRVRLAYQAAKAVEYLGARGIVHGNLTSNSFLLEGPITGPEFLQLVLANLGRSRPLRKAYSLARVPTTLDPRILPPEVISVPGAIPEQQSADVWAFGWLLVEILTGEKPLGSYDHSPAMATAVTQQILSGFRPELPALLVPEALQKLIRACWAADPVNRPSMANIAYELNLVQAQLVNEDENPELYQSTNYK